MGGPAGGPRVAAGRPRPVTKAAGRLLLSAGLLLPAGARAGPDLPWPVYRMAAPAAPADPLDAAVESFHVAQEPIALAFLSVSRSYGVTFVLDPGLKGEVTLEVRQGTVRDLVEALAKSQGLYWQREGRLIAVRRNVTRFYEIDYPQMTRSAQGGSNVSLSAQGGTAAGGSPPRQRHPRGNRHSGAGAGPPRARTTRPTFPFSSRTRIRSGRTCSPNSPGSRSRARAPSSNKFAGLAVVTAPPAPPEDFQGVHRDGQPAGFPG